MAWEQAEGNDTQYGKWEAVAEWYHAYFTGLLLTVVTRQGTREAADFTYHIFRRQHKELFLDGLKKLGLDALPPAVAAARYHYLSNAIGGVHVEYIEESSRKAWVRYSPPRWAWHGTAICGIPGEVSRAVLQGWHAYNGVSLGTDRLGFVCTKQTMDGQSGLEGYYYEYEHAIAPDERLRFARGEEAPVFDPSKAPVLPTSDWPLVRKKKAKRNYAMAYVRTAIPELVGLFGPADAIYLGGLAGQLIGMQFYRDTAKALNLPLTGTASDFGRFMVELARSQDDVAELYISDKEVRVRQQTWRLMSGLSNLHTAVFDVWNSLLVGACQAHNRMLILKPVLRMDEGDEYFEWVIKPRGLDVQF